MIAGLIGGPIVGLGAGIIGGLHRYFLGGFTCVPCSSATILAGLAGGLIHRYRGGRLLTPLGAALFGIIFESFHMIFVMAYSKPSLQAIELVATISLPMIFANSLGLTLFSFVLINHKKQRATIAAKERIEGELGLAK
jgi:sigma-B regulation protein RsbU (phosphoserine phosphatase)